MESVLKWYYTTNVQNRLCQLFLNVLCALSEQISWVSVGGRACMGLPCLYA